MRSWKGSIRRICNNNSGITAIEFALIGPVFFLLIMGLFEVTILLGQSAVIENAVFDAARVVRTGQAQNSPDPLGTFRATLCGDALVGFVQCDDLTFNVQVFPSFADTPLEVEINEEGVIVDGDGVEIEEVFEPGTAEDIVVVRVFHIYSFFTPLIGRILGNGGGDTFLMVFAAVFRSEPYLGF